MSLPFLVSNEELRCTNLHCLFYYIILFSLCAWHLFIFFVFCLSHPCDMKVSREQDAHLSYLLFNAQCIKYCLAHVCSIYICWLIKSLREMDRDNTYREDDKIPHKMCLYISDSFAELENTSNLAFKLLMFISLWWSPFKI